MRKYIILFFSFLIFFACAQAQQSSVKGTITDTITKQPMVNTVVSLLKQKDSVLYQFTRTDAGGKFSFNNIHHGDYLIFVSHPRYADYMDKIHVDSIAEKDAGTVWMWLRANLLQDVVVKSKIAAIQMKGDTVEYRTDSFKVREGANVEELLKRLPGIQIDKDGKITAMGETVNKVLVDGEEFFGDDPTVATKNLQADAVEKVQVFDKKSDQATFTGIDDGNTQKTINLKLKEDKKKGYFGKLEMGAGLNDRWNSSAMINNFKGKKKFSAYGIMSSTGKTGLNWDESSKFGGGDDNMQYDEDNGFMYSVNTGDDFSNPSYYGEGLPKSWSAGANFSNRFNYDKQNFNGSYRYNKINNEGAGNTITQQITETDVLNRVEAGNTFSSKQRHSLNGTYEWNIDSTTSLKIKASGYTGTSFSFSTNTQETKNKINAILNRQLSNTTMNSDNNSITTNVLLRKKFKKAGRSFSFSFDQGYNDNAIDGYLFAQLDTLDVNGALVPGITDQRKLNNNITNTLNSKITYTEPIAKKLFLELNYAVRLTTNDAEKLTYNKSNNGKYENLSDTFSNHYKFNVLTNSVGSFFKYNGKKINVTAGTDIGFTDFKQTDVFTSILTKRDFTNFFPRANLNIKFDQSTRFNFNYNGSTQQPTINQIQPVQDNSNPLNITIGNPNLNQAFNHRFSMNMNSFKVLKERGFWVYSNFSFVQDAIVTNTTIDNTTGKTTNQYINASGNYNYYGGGTYFMKLKKLGANVDFGVGINGSKYSSFLNNIRNTTLNTAPSIRLGLGKNKEKKFNLWYNAEIAYNFSKTIVGQTTTINYLTQSHNLNFTVQLPWKMEVNTEMEINLRQKTEQFPDNNNVWLWNGYVGKKIFKNDKGLIKLYAYDILNQNKGFDRFISGNQFTERNYQKLTQYTLLSFVWNFSKTPGAVNTPSE